MNATETSEYNDLNFLKEFKLLLTYGSKVSANYIAKKNGVKNISAKLIALQRGKIISKTRSRRWAEWNWISKVNPNIHMVRKMRDDVTRLNIEKGQRRLLKEKKAAKNILQKIDFDRVEKTNVIAINSNKGGARTGAGRKSLVKGSTEISIFWGMFKLKTSK